MSTQVFLRSALASACDNFGGGSSAWNPNSAFASPGDPLGILSTRLARGASLVSATGSTVASGTLRYPFRSGGATVYFVSPPLDRNVTIASTVTFNLWGLESSMNANCQIGCYVARLKADGTVDATAVATATEGAELGTSAAVNNFTASPTSTAFLKGDRLLIVPYWTNIGTQASGFTITFGYDGATAGADGDSYVTFTENFGFIEDAPGSVTSPDSATAADVGGSNATAQRAVSLWSPMARTLTAVRVRAWKSAAPTDNLLVELQADSSGNPSGTALTSGSIAGTTLTTSPADYDLDVADYAMAADTKYWLVFKRSGAISGTNFFNIGQQTTPANGLMRDSSVGTNLSVWTPGTVQFYTGIDFTFSAGSTLYPTNTAGGVDPNGATYDSKEIWTSRGSGSASASITTAAAATPPGNLWTVTEGGNFIEWFSKPVQAFTLAGPVLTNVRIAEGDTAANASFTAEVAVCDADGTNPVVWGWTTHGAEASTTEAARQLLVSADDVAVTDGKRLRLRLYLEDSNAAALGAAQVATITYAGTSGGAAGDTYLTFGQTLLEYSAGTNTPQAVAATTTLTPVVGRKANKLIAPSLAMTTAIVRKTLKPVAIVMTLAVAIAKRMVETVTATTALTAGVAKRVGKTIAATTTLTAALVTVKSKAVAIAAATTFTVGFIRGVGKPVPVALSSAVGITRRTPKLIAAATTVSVTMSRGISKFIAAAVTVTPVLSKRITKFVDVVTTAVADAATQFNSGSGVHLEYTFEGGSDETTITSSDTGSGDHFDSLTIGANGAEAKYDTAWAAKGSLSGRFTAGNPTGIATAIWTGLNTTAPVWLRSYARFVIPSPVNFGVWVVKQQDDTTTALNLRLNTTGKMSILDSSNAIKYTTTKTFTNLEAFRVELKVTPGAGTGACELRLFFGANIDGTTPDESTTLTSQQFGTGIGALTIGVNQGTGTSVWYDGLGVSTTDWLGPIVGGNTPQAVAAAAAFTVAVVRGTGKPIAAATSVTVALARNVGKPIAAATTLTAALVRRVGKLVAATTTVSPSLSRTVSKVVAATASLTVALTRRVGKLISIAASIGAALDATKSSGISAVEGTPFIASASVTSGSISLASMSPQAGDIIVLFVSVTASSGTITGPGGVWNVGAAGFHATSSTSHTHAMFWRAWQSGDTDPTVTCASGRLLIVPIRLRGVNTSTPFEGGVTTNAGGASAATTIAAPSVTPTNSRFLLIDYAGRIASAGASATYTPQGNTTEISDRSTAVAAASNQSQEVVTRVLADASATGTETTTATQTVDGTSIVTLLQAASTGTNTPQSVDIVATLVVAVVRNVQKPIAAAATVAVAITKQIGKPIAAAATLSVGLLKNVRKAITAPITVTAVLVVQKTIQRVIAATTTLTVALTKNVGKPIAVAATFAVTLTRRAGKLVAIGMTVAVAITKASAELVAVTATLVVALTKRVGRLIPVNVTMAVVAGAHIAIQRAIAATTTVTVSLSRSVGKLVPVTATLLVALSRRMVETVAVTTTLIVSLTRRSLETIAVGATFAVALVRRVGKVVAVTAPVTAVLVAQKTVQKAVAVTVTLTVAIAKRTTELIATTTTFVVTLTRRISKTIDAALTLVVALTKRSFETVAVSLPMAVTVFAQKTLTKAIAVTATLTVVVSRNVGKLVPVTTALVVSVAKSTTKLIAVPITFAITLVRRVGKPVAVGVSFAVLIARTTTKFIAATTTLLVSVAAAKVKAITIAATTTVIAAVRRSTGKLVTTTSTVVAAVSRQTSVPVAAALSFVVSVSRRTSKLVDAALPFVVSVTKRIPKAIAATVTFVVTVARGANRFATIAVIVTITATVGAVKGLHATFQQTVAVTLMMTASIRRGITHRIAVTTTLIAHAFARLVEFLWPPTTDPGDGWVLEDQEWLDWPISQGTEDDEWTEVH